MTRREFSSLALTPVMTSYLTSLSRSADPGEKTVRDVAKAVVAHSPSAKDLAGFTLQVVDPIPSQEIVARGGWDDWADGRRTPYVRLTRSSVPLLEKSPDGSALLIAREIAGLIAKPADTDRVTVELVLRSGYSVRQGLAQLASLAKCQAEAERKLWADWLARLRKHLDEPTGTPWRVMPAWQIGEMFEAVGAGDSSKFPLAMVTSEFPHTAEPRLRQLEAYLSSKSVRQWWRLVCPPVERLCHFLGRPHKHLNPQSRTPRPAITSVSLPGKRKITLGDDPDETLNLLLPPSLSTSLRSSALQRLRFDKSGLELVISDKILLIAVIAAHGPAIPIPAAKSGEPSPGEVKVGMKRMDAERVLAGSGFRMPFVPDGGPSFEFYPDLGLAVRYDSAAPDITVTGLVLGRVDQR